MVGQTLRWPVSTGDALATATLDTLPLNVAVLAPDGEILHTNEAWRAYARENGADSVDHVGQNYLDVTKSGDDEFAQLATEGIRRVANGEQERYTLEYPCHSPDEDRWYLMRVSRFEAEGQTRVVVAHIDVTERKLAELEVAATAQELAAERATLDNLVERIQGLLRKVTEALVEADSREAIERTILDVLTDDDPFDGAWIGTPDPADAELSPTAWAGTDERPSSIDLSGDSPMAIAYRDRELQVVTDVRAAPESAWQSRARSAGHESIAAVPLVGNERCYGVLTLVADRPVEMDEREQVVFGALGRQVGTAIAAIESKTMLATDSVVELKVAIDDPSLYVAGLAPGVGDSATYAGLVSRPDGTSVELYAVEGGTDAELDEMTDHCPDVDSVTILAEHDGERLVEIQPAESLVVRLAAFGADVQSMTIDETVELVLQVANDGDSRAVFEALTESYDGVELLAHGRRERPERSATELQADLSSALTDRQHEALRKAYVAGFFEWPRPVDGDALAESMGVSRPTFHQHLRIAERKVLAELFDDDPN